MKRVAKKHVAAVTKHKPEKTAGRHHTNEVESNAPAMGVPSLQVVDKEKVKVYRYSYQEDLRNLYGRSVINLHGTLATDRYL